MLSTPLEERYKFRANIRPIKFAHFIREDDTASLIRILRFVNTQWGGIRSLIIPVKPDLTIASMFINFLQFHEPDGFVEYLMDRESGDYEEVDQLKLYLDRLFPHRPIELQHSKDFEESDISMHALGIISEDELKNNVLVTHEIDLLDLPEYVGLALYGSIFSGQETAYSDSIKLERKSISVRTREFWESQFNTDPYSSVLNLTSYLITPYATLNTKVSNHFDVIYVNSVTSLCLYWNCRAFRESVQYPGDKIGRRTFLLPSELLHNRDAIESLIEFIREYFPHPRCSANKHIFFYQWNPEDIEQIRSVLSTFDNLEFSDDKFSIDDRRYGGRPLEPESLIGKKLIYTSGYIVYSALYHEGIGPELPLITSMEFPVSLNYENNEVYFDPPPKYTNRFGGWITLDLECDVWQRYARGYWVAQKIRQSSWFSRYGISMITRIQSRTTSITFNLPTEWDSLHLFFEGKGYQIQRSKDGQYAEAVVKLVGDLRDIELLSTKQTYVLLDMLALKSTRKIAQRLVEMLRIDKDKESEIEKILGEMEIAPELKGIPKTYSQLYSDQKLKPFRTKLLDLLDQLSKAQIIKRGFYLSCPHCGAPDWYPLLSLNELVLCSGCSNKFPLPVETPKGSEIKWQYRLNTLINRAVEQAVLPSVFSLYHTTKNRKTSCMTIGLELVKENIAVKEFDFLFVSKQKIYAGECKAGSILEQKDMDAAVLAAQLGFAKFYFCTVREFNEDSLRQINEVKKRIEKEDLKMSIEIFTEEHLLGEL